MTTNVISEMAEKWYPFHWTQFFSSQRAPDMWFGDEAPPTMQADIASPFVQQSMWMLQHTVRQAVDAGVRQQAMVNERRRLTALASRVGKRRKTSGHAGRNAKAPRH